MASRRNDDSDSWLTPKNILIATAGAGIAAMVAPTVAQAVGFTSSGIKSGSPAASMMSSLCGGETSAGSPVAVLQSVGAKSTVFDSPVATTAALATGAAASLMLARALESKSQKW